MAWVRPTIGAETVDGDRLGGLEQAGLEQARQRAGAGRLGWAGADLAEDAAVLQFDTGVGQVLGLGHGAQGVGGVAAVLLLQGGAGEGGQHGGAGGEAGFGGGGGVVRLAPGRYGGGERHGQREGDEDEQDELGAYGPPHVRSRAGTLGRGPGRRA
jgi:hypothetical protein